MFLIQAAPTSIKIPSQHQIFALDLSVGWQTCRITHRPTSPAQVGRGWKLLLSGICPEINGNCSNCGVSVKFLADQYLHHKATPISLLGSCYYFVNNFQRNTVSKKNTRRIRESKRANNWIPKMDGCVWVSGICWIKQESSKSSYTDKATT